MASLYDLLCYHSLTCTDPLLEELLAYLPTRFHSHIFDYIAYEHSLDEESVHSIDSSVSAFYFDDSTSFSQLFYILLLYFFYATTNFFTTRTVAHDIQKGRRPGTTDDPQERPEALNNPKPARIGE